MTLVHATSRVFAAAQMNDGDQVVLACLKEHRGRLSRACAKVLTDHGQ